MKKVFILLSIALLTSCNHPKPPEAGQMSDDDFNEIVEQIETNSKNFK